MSSHGQFRPVPPAGLESAAWQTHRDAAHGDGRPKQNAVSTAARRPSFAAALTAAAFTITACGGPMPDPATVTDARSVAETRRPGRTSRTLILPCAPTGNGGLAINETSILRSSYPAARRRCGDFQLVSNELRRSSAEELAHEV